MKTLVARPHPCRIIIEPDPEANMTEEQRQRRNEKMKQYRELYRERYRKKVELARQGKGEWPS